MAGSGFKKFLRLVVCKTSFYLLIVETCRKRIIPGKRLNADQHKFKSDIGFLAISRSGIDPVKGEATAALSNRSYAQEDTDG